MLLITGNLAWFTVRLDASTLEVTGQAAAPPLSGLALASVALAGALALAPLALRVVLGILQTILGVLALLVVVPALTDPVARAAATVTEATGVDGDASVRAAIVGIASSPWPVTALVAAVLSVAAGVFVIATARRWPVPGRRYAAAPEVPAPGAARARAEDEWDALSRGDDPTS